MSDNRVEVWHLIGSLQVGGANQTLIDLVNNLDANVFDVTIWALLDTNPLATDLKDHITLRVLDASGKFDLYSVGRFLAAVRHERPDVLQSWLFYDNTLARLASAISPETQQVSGVRAVPKSPSHIRAAVDRLTMSLADRVVSNSQGGRELAIGRGCDPDSVSVIRNGRDIDEFASAIVSETLLGSLDIPNDAKIAGTVGRLIERKGHRDLIDAWPSVVAEHPTAQLLIVGDGPEYNHLAKRASLRDVEHSVHLPGTRTDIPELMAMLDLFVFPSHFEGLPGALIEAMAAGLPIVATDVAGNDELICDGTTGVLVPAQCPGDLATAINRLLRDASVASELGERAASEARGAYSIDRMVRDYSALYRCLC